MGMVLGNRVIIVRADPRFQSGQFLGRSQCHRPATMRLGRHTAALALPSHQPAHAPLTHPEADCHLRLTAFASLPGGENPLAQIQRIRFCHPSTYGHTQANSTA